MGDVIELSHRINEIMLNFFRKEDFLEMLVHCVESMIMIPRFELISTIDVFGEYMIDRNKSNDDLKRKVNNIRKQAELWIFSSENKNFFILWNDYSKVVPEKIQDMYIDAFSSDFGKLLEEYVKDLDEFANKIEEKMKKYLRKWLLETDKESEKKTEESEKTHLRELDYERELEEKRAYDKKFIGGKTFKERQKEEEEAMKIQPKESKKMEKIRKITDLKYMNSIQELKKTDKERFTKIFYAFEKKIGKISDEIKNMIMRLWYGDYYAKEHSDSDDILSIINRYSLHLKIPNNHINGEVNRLILQTYIVGLYMGVSVFDIYTIINNVLEANPTMTIHKIMPSMIHDGNVPNLKIQEVLNSIIKNLPLHENQNIIRTNWNKIRFPSINISALVTEIQSLNLDSSLEFKIIRLIEELSDSIIKKGLTIERFAREVYQILKKQTAKIPITEKQIISLLDYE